MKKFRAGVVGTGFIGVAHIEALRRMGNVDVVALADTSGADQKAEALCVPKGYASYKDMIDSENLDAIHICTPNSTHCDIALYAIEKGVAVICEKPMATSAEQAKKMADLAKEKGVVNAINFNLRFNPLPYQLKQMVKSGDLGEIFTVHGSYLQDWLYYDTDYSWRLEPELSGESRAFADIGSHWIDMVESVTGLKAVAVMADFATFHKTRKKPLKPIATYSGMALKPEDYAEVPITTEDYCTVMFKFDNGARGTVVVSQVYAGRKNQMIVSVGGSKCAAHWDSENGNELWIGRRDGYNQVAVKDPSVLYGETGKVISYPGGHVEGFPDTIKQNFISIYRAIGEHDTSKGDFATFEDGLREMLLCDKIVESAKKQAWVEI
ncbi:Gfo/Idh/MocA family oxidoreductase [Hydrogenoanaerobacterium sp.]|uniref:Gfo/Idh/MocA family protein n=1 Tax=Hydrogenoanaerobacterium sp. TaxID=2953763 RepID=UPI00289F6452|nr:Gfo/Idh/MocA family oxidoreductase [Hydrogenoanaerobacterium sp.]